MDGEKRPTAFIDSPVPRYPPIRPRDQAASLAPREQREIEAALSEMFSELDCLGSEIAEMAERLKPVLAPEGPEADGGKPQEAAGSFVMGQIRLASSVIADKRYRLRSLCRRVEL